MSTPPRNMPPLTCPAPLPKEWLKRNPLSRLEQILHINETCIAKISEVSDRTRKIKRTSETRLTKRQRYEKPENYLRIETDN